MSKIFEQLLQKRHFDQDFLSPRYESLADPFELSDIEKAVTRIEQAIKQDELILIYGDYDVDGVTASIIMEQTLSLAGVNPEHLEIMLPDRFADGYGMSPKLIRRAKDQGINLVITVDCGSRNHEIITELNELGIDTIITDHHEVAETLPPALAIINPHRQDHPTSSLQNLAGAGVAFKLAQALVQKGLIPDGQEKWLLDLVLLGTICDNMLLTGENRILSFYGMRVLAKTRRPGLKELMKSASVKQLNSDAIGFQIGPRLNAAGRLDTAVLALDLLRTNSKTEAAALATKLEELNKKRKQAQNVVLKEIKTRGITDEPVIIETGKWHEGVVGIIAGRLVEDYQRPAFVLTELEKNIFKGSGRSFGDFNLAEALKFVKETIISGGGHAAAAGVRIDGTKLYEFREKINQYYRSLNLSDQSRYLERQSDLTLDDFSELSLDLLQELKTLEPYGLGNEEPIFHLRNVQIMGVTRMGSEQNHLRLDLQDQDGRQLKLVAFYAPEKWLSINSEYDHIEPLVRITENDFNGVKSLEARICDIIFV